MSEWCSSPVPERFCWDSDMPNPAPPNPGPNPVPPNAGPKPGPKPATKAAKKRAPKAVLITPGAGSSSTHSSLVAIETALLALRKDLVVRRIDFPYRLAGRRAPDRAPVLIKTVVDAATGLIEELGISPDELVIGGRSMGGRMCSIAVAEGLAVGRLFCVSYPLLPPGKPESLRVEHFARVSVDTLFVSGTRDAFGTRAEFEHHTPSLAGPFRHEWIEGGDHGLARREQVAAKLVADWVVG